MSQLLNPASRGWTSYLTWCRCRCRCRCRIRVPAIERLVDGVTAATRGPVSVRLLDDATFGQGFGRLGHADSHVRIHVR